MKKLEIHCCKPLTAKEGNTIRAIVPDDTLNELHELSERTGYPMSQLARLLRYGRYSRTDILGKISS
ncbi:MAG: hypothetical protein PUC41_05185 [Oscillospiraceae bacterium]|nr:hypothetical protein [Oscillospiraceae bacterium]